MAAVNRKRSASSSGRTRSSKPRAKSGEQITEELGESLAKEAEAGYDLSRSKRQRVGRPSLGTEGRSPRVTFRVAPRLYRAARAQARREGRTVSELAREALARYVEGR